MEIKLINRWYDLSNDQRKTIADNFKAKETIPHEFSELFTNAEIKILLSETQSL